MRRFPRLCFSISVALFAAVGGFAAADDEHAEFRTVVVTVLDARGKPAPRVQVRLTGLERDAMRTDENSRDPDWSFITDSRGRFTARFGMFKSTQHEDEGHRYLPGWGTFYFVAMKSGTAGAVSPRIENYSWKAGEQGSSPRERDEWSRGRTTRLRSEKTRVSMQFQKELRVTGRVVDRRGHPIEGVKVSLSHDLHVWSHTGYGGEIFAQTGFSDHAGRFVFRHVYPARFDLQMGMPNQDLHWSKTKVRGKWSSENVDEIVPRSGERSITATIVEENHVRFRYFGRITDHAGRPVSGATVGIGISTHRVPKTYEDDHQFFRAVTDQDGGYEISATSPFARSMWVKAQGFKDGERDFDGSPVAPPGLYDFSLLAGDAAEAEK